VEWLVISGDVVGESVGDVFGVFFLVFFELITSVHSNALSLELNLDAEGFVIKKLLFFVFNLGGEQHVGVRGMVRYGRAVLMAL
jgi:hypothetical protein